MINKHINKINNLLEKMDEISNIQKELSDAYKAIRMDGDMTPEKEDICSRLVETNNRLMETGLKHKEEIKTTGEMIAEEIEKSGGNKKTLKELKIDVEGKKIKFKTIYNSYCTTLRLKNNLYKIREIGDVKSESFYLLDENNKKSWVEYPNAKNMLYTDHYLVIYSDYDKKVEIIYEIIRED